MVEHRADSLKYQWRIVGLVMRSSWATGIDKSVAFEIVDNYRKDFGNSRASLGYLQKATGADRKSVIASTRRLVEQGPFSVVRQGIGTRPTEYSINFDLVADSVSSGVPTTTSQSEPSSGVEPTPCSGVEPTTNGSSSGVDSTESVLPVDGLQADVQERMLNDCAPPTAPPGSAPNGPPGAGSAQGFDELWTTYGYKHKKRDAQAEYRHLAPDAAKHDELVQAASLWRRAADSRSDPSSPRKYLHTWLRDEEFECDPPVPFKPREKIKTTRPATSSTSMTRKASRPARVVDIVAADLAGPSGASQLVLTMSERDRAEQWNHIIDIESSVAAKQEQGQKEFTRLVKALGLHAVEDSKELVGHAVTVATDALGFLSYEPAEQIEGTQHGI